MMKKMQKVQKIAALSVAGLLSCSAFAACGPTGGNDGTKSELKIAVFNGGFGYAWLEELKSSFEETFKDVSFEPGKKGVYISLTPDKSLFSSLETKMLTGADTNDIYYTSTSDFKAFTDLNVAHDVTNIMTANVYDEDGNVVLNAAGDGWETKSEYTSIADRISYDITREKLNVGTEEAPQYYVLPFEDTVASFVVDWDLFVDQGWNNYNGIDGMPATINEFYDLLNRIRRKGYSAFIMSPSVNYTNSIEPAIIAQVDGTDTYYDLFGDYTGEYDFNEDGTISNDEKITPSNAYKLIDTRGYKAAVEMAMKLFEKDSTGKTFFDPGVQNKVSYGAAQIDFVTSLETDTKIAMLFEGEWWENEARATFNAMGAVNEDNGYGKREFRMMPIPSFDETNGDPNTKEDDKYTLGTWSDGCITVVNENTVGNDPLKQKLSELWLQYQNSTVGLKCFTKHTSVTLPLDYELTDDELQELTPFGRDLYKLKRDSRVELIHGGNVIESEQVYRGAAKLGFTSRYNGATYGGGSLFNGMVALIGKTCTVSDYIAGMHTYYDDLFKTAYPSN